MRKLGLLLLCSTALSVGAFAQDLSLKYGKVTNYELSMKTYDKDSTAEAVILYDDGYACYEYANDNFKIRLETKQKIKILKQEGVDRATITLPYYYKSNGERDVISGLEAYSYNLENGKAVKTKLEKKYIFDEEVNAWMRRLKFSVPNVKVGSVIELKYERSTSHWWDLPEWSFQSSIPVVYSNYEVLIPEYFVYNNEIKGYETVKVTETSQSQQFNLGMSENGPITVTCQNRDVKFTASNVPALKDEPFVWFKHDFSSGVRFELSGTKFPNSFYKAYTQTWENLEANIRKDYDLGSNIKMSNPFKVEIKALTDTVKSEQKKIELIYAFIKKKIKWNDSYSFSGNQAKDAIKNKTGDNGQINMILLSALKDAHIKAYPILISRRSQGRIPYTYPSIDKLTTTIIAAQTQDSLTFYMDGSAVYGGLNMLPTDLLVDRGRVFEETINEKWVDMTKIVKNQSVYIISSELGKDGALKGTINTGFTNQLAYAYKSKFYGAKDSADFVEKYESALHLKINKFEVSGKDTMSNMVKENFSFTKELTQEGDFMYINPMLILHIEKNPFTQSERKLPIEFDYPQSFQMTTKLDIPDNYKVEELPKSIKISLPNNAGKCLYYITQENNTVQLNYRFDLAQSIFSQESYSSIREFYAQVATKNAEMIVLKKIK